jgi:DNA repair protein RecN (Recombination protein N)
MLEHLAAKNLGLIKDAELIPAAGLTVITGETGAGKTLLLGALRLLLGETSDSSIVGPFGDQAVAEGLFVDEVEIPISRVVPREGRSRSYRDGVIVSAGSLQEEMASRIQIIGQHDQFDLKKGRYVLDLIDRNLGEAGANALQEYALRWKALVALLEEQSQLGGSQSELARELDLTRYQHEEISRAGFVVDEDVKLEQDAARLRNIDEIREHMSASDRVLEQLSEVSGELVSYLRKVASLDETAMPLAETAESLAISTNEMSREVSTRFENLSDDPETALQIEQRLNLLGDLKMKYGRTIEEITAFGEASRLRAIELEDLLGRATSIDEEVEGARHEVATSANGLSEIRQKVAADISTQIARHLEDVGLGGATAAFGFQPSPPGASGIDKVEFLFSSHNQLHPGPISRVASGGELSRLILAVSLSTGTEQKQTLVFDEVDAGVGGVTALEMGRKLADLASRQQVLCVTHLPQVAAFADRHYVIDRNESEASLGRVDGPSRLEELSRMIAGLPESDRGQQAAAELLEVSGK